MNRILRSDKARQPPRGMTLRRCLLSLALGLPTMTPTVSSGVSLFATPFLSFDVGAHPWDVASSDLNGDKQADLAVVNQGSNTISILLGNGDGTFARKTDLGTGVSPVAVAIGDLNGDGAQDLAIANLTDSVSVLLGNGDGSFRPRSDFPTGLSPFAVVVADLDLDGCPDLVTSNADANSISVLLGNGDGTFRPRIDFPTGTTPFSLALGDLNGDERLDLVVANAGSNTVSVLLGNRDALFGPKIDFGTGNMPFSIAAGDLNGDGRLDLGIANADSSGEFASTVSILLGNGDGTFGVKSDFAVGNRPFSVAIGDLSGDGRPDLAVANAGSSAHPGSTISVLLGNGDGTFRAKSDFDTGRSPLSVAIGEFSGDRLPDLVAANLGSNSVSILLGNGDGTFGHGTDFAAGRLPFDVAIADLNLDGQPDLAVPDQASDMVSVLLGNGEGEFGAMTNFAVGNRPFSVAIADLNLDGQPDLAVANQGSDAVSVLLGNGDGTFRAKTDFETGSSPSSVAIADLSGDGRPDLAVANHGSDAVSVLLGNGDGTFRAKTDFETGSSPSSVAIADLSGDGRPDLAVVNAGSILRPDSTISVLLGNGDGTFGPKIDLPVGRNPASFAIGDLTDDGRLDVAVANQVSNTVSIFLGNGDGTFSGKTTVGTGKGTVAVVIGDFNADRRSDVAATNGGSNTVSVLFGVGDGTFFERTDFGTGSGPNSVAIGDLNMDGRPDLAISNFGSTVSVLLNRGLSPVEVAVSDLEATASEGRVRITWRLSSAAFQELQGIVIRRGTAAGGPYVTLNANLLQPAREMSFEDVGLESGRYWYQLLLVSRSGSQVAMDLNVLVGSSASPLSVLYPPHEPADGEPIQISYSLAAVRMPVRLAVYDVRGRMIWSSERSERDPGLHTQVWDRRGSSGARVTRGMYFVELDAAGAMSHAKLLLVHP